MLMLCAIIPKDLTSALVKLGILVTEKIALVTIKHHNSLTNLTWYDKDGSLFMPLIIMEYLVIIYIWYK